MMRKITQLLMHDSAVQLTAFGSGWTDFHSEKYELDSITRNWLNMYLNPVYEPMPEEMSIERIYTAADDAPSTEITAAYGDVPGPGVINLEVYYHNRNDGDTWIEHVTYCGHFTVWWENATE